MVGALTVAAAALLHPRRRRSGSSTRSFRLSPCVVLATLLTAAIASCFLLSSASFPASRRGGRAFIVASDFASSGSSERLQASRRLRPRSIVARGAAVKEEAPPEIVDAKAQTMEVKQEEVNLFQMLWDGLSEFVEFIDDRFYLNLSESARGTTMKVVLLVMLPLVVSAALKALGVEELQAGSFTTMAAFVGVLAWASAAVFRAFTQQPTMNEKEVMIKSMQDLDDDRRALGGSGGASGGLEATRGRR